MNYQHNQEFVKAFGEHLKKLRAQRGYSMRSFAVMADIEYKQLSRIERGEINTTISTAYTLAEVLNIPLRDLFDFKMPGKPQ